MRTLLLFALASTALSAGEPISALPHHGDVERGQPSMVYFIPPTLIQSLAPSKGERLPVMLCVADRDPNAAYIAVFGRQMSRISFAPASSCAAFMWTRTRDQDDVLPHMAIFEDVIPR